MVTTSKNYKELRLTVEQTKIMVAMLDNIKDSQHEINRATNAGINMTEQQKILNDVKDKRHKLLAVYGAK